MSAHRKTRKPPRSAGQKTQQGVIIVSGLFIVGIVLVSMLLAGSVPDAVGKSGTAVGITTLLLFFAAGAVGSGLGFLFGLPRSRFIEDANAAPSATGTKASGPSFLANSNLIKVSDWLTTIVIGLGLVNLAKIGPALSTLQGNLVAPLGGGANAGVIGVSIILVGLLAGMLLTFLWTTIRVRELFEQSEQDIDSYVPALVGSTVAAATSAMAGTPFRLQLPEGAPGNATIASQSVAPTYLTKPGTTVSVEVTRPTSGRVHSNGDVAHV
jgi:hypothetical protein